MTSFDECCTIKHDVGKKSSDDRRVMTEAEITEQCPTLTIFQRNLNVKS